MNLAFIGPFKHAGLSLSIGLSACLNAGCLCYFLIKKKLYQPRDGWYGFLLKLLTAVIIMGLAIELCLYQLPLDFTGNMFMRIGALVVIIIAAAIAYFVSLFALGFRVRDFSHKDHF